jgi:hypothetical protein
LIFSKNYFFFILLSGLSKKLTYNHFSMSFRFIFFEKIE